MEWYPIIVIGFPSAAVAVYYAMQNRLWIFAPKESAEANATVEDGQVGVALMGDGISGRVVGMPDAGCGNDGIQRFLCDVEGETGVLQHKIVLAPELQPLTPYDLRNVMLGNTAAATFTVVSGGITAQVKEVQKNNAALRLENDGLHQRLREASKDVKTQVDEKLKEYANIRKMVGGGYTYPYGRVGYGTTRIPPIEGGGEE